MWPLLSGANSTSPRAYTLLGSSDGGQKVGNTIIQGVVRADGYKLLTGDVDSAFWTGPTYPNASGWPSASADCGKGYLYNIKLDPTEHNEISAQYPEIVAELAAIIADESKRVFNPVRGTDDGEMCLKAFGVHGGFIGPFLDE